MDTEIKGRIFDIQRYSIHDGTGIRTIIFLKGCALRCRWCCNPESQEFEIQTMLVQGAKKTIGKDVTVREVYDIIERDRAYYRRSGGGVTLSGGESLLQPEFTLNLLKICAENGIKTAMESTGCTKYETIAEILPYLDQFLYDIKHVDSSKHKEFTGRANDLMLENAKKVALSKQTELIIRVPVIPTFNSEPQDISEIARFAASLPGVAKLHLLPYHRLGQDKYDGLNREYTMKHVVPPTPEYMQTLLAVAVEASGLNCQIGG